MSFEIILLAKLRAVLGSSILCHWFFSKQFFVPVLVVTVLKEKNYVKIAAV